MTPNDPKRGEVWIVDFNPTVGEEIYKQRPAVVLSSDAIGTLNLKIVAPITEWKPTFENNVWHVRIDPSGRNGLSKTSAVDLLQVRSVAVLRFIRKLGLLQEIQMSEALQALAIVVEWK